MTLRTHVSLLVAGCSLLLCLTACAATNEPLIRSELSDNTVAFVSSEGCPRLSEQRDLAIVAASGQSMVIDLRKAAENERFNLIFKSLNPVSGKVLSPLESGEFVVALKGGVRHELPLAARLSERFYPFAIFNQESPECDPIDPVVFIWY